MLTDGFNNAGNVDPTTAARIASKYNIKIYSIGIAKDETDTDAAPIIKQIALITSGKYFPVDKKEALNTVIEEINEMEKSKFQDKNYKLRYEYAFLLINIGILLILLAFILDHFVFLQVP